MDVFMGMGVMKDLNEGGEMGGVCLSTDSGDCRGSTGAGWVFEDFLDAVGEGFVGPCPGDGAESNQEQEGGAEFRFHGMRMLFVFV